MKVRQHSNRAILVLECPWELDDGDSNRSSVLPFVEGVAKFAGDTEVFHANFYDLKSFESALDCLCKVKYQNTIVYVAAHGYKKQIGNAGLLDALVRVGLKSKAFNITGVVLGACYVGENRSTLEVCIQETNINWITSYSSSVNWLPGTMIDCAVLARMSILDDSDYSSREVLIESLGEAISPFSESFSIGNNYHKEKTRFADSLQVVVQPSGQGYKPKLVTGEVFSACQRFQLSMS